MTTATKPDFASMRLEQLEETHSDMLATAYDLGFTVPDNLTAEFSTQEEGISRCSDLHDAIRKFSAGLDAQRAENSDKKSLASETKTAQDLPDTRTGRALKKKAESAQKPKPTASTKPSTSANSKKEKNTVAKKVAPKKTAKKSAPKTAKKSAPKTAKKSAPKTAKAAGTGAHSLPLAGIITVKTKDKENPCRKGSGKFERVAQIFKFDGKTVDQAVKGGVRKGSLNFCREQGWISIK